MDRGLVVLGSGNLAQTLIANGLIDVYELWVDPIVLGKGKCLFPEGTPRIALELLETTTSSTGVAMLTYRPADA